MCRLIREFGPALDPSIATTAFIVEDREGKVFWSYLSPIDVNPGADGVLDALERLDGEQPDADMQPGGHLAGNAQQEEGRP